MAKACTSRWEDARTAAAVLAVDPTGVAGISLRSAAGPVRDIWLAQCIELFPRKSPWQRVPLSISDDRLLGGLDLAATLRAGRPVAQQGILAQADGGVIALSMAERLAPATAAKIGCVLDSHEVLLERDGFARRTRTRFAVIALDEGIEPDERPPDSLLERLGLHIDLNGLSVSAATNGGKFEILRARNQLAHVHVTDEMLVALCEISAALGIASARAAWFALRVTRALAALSGRTQASEDDITLAARLVFAPRALKAPVDGLHEDSRTADQQSNVSQTPEQTAECSRVSEKGQDGRRSSQEHPAQPLAQSPETRGGGTTQPEQQRSTAKQNLSASQTEQIPAGSLRERVLAATTASLPADLLGQLQSAQLRSTDLRHSGRSGVAQLSHSGGRPTGTRAGDLKPGARVSVVETLRAAAPWQHIRRLARERALRAASERPRASGESRPSLAVQRRAPLVHVMKDDIRAVRFNRRSRSTTIFLVDASGSAALHRLAEAKGAVELMLAESYVRRDRVALISFRGVAAQILLPPTNSLVRAKRELATLPGGGGTPLATGIDTARVLADSLKRRGESPMVVVLTDGHPNIARDGKGSRSRAEADAVSAARMMRTYSIASLMVDTAPRPRMLTEQFAREMGARYVPLPCADAGTLASIVSGCGRSAPGRHEHA